MMKERTRAILIILAGVVFAVSLGAVVYQHVRYGQNNEAIQEAQELAGVPRAENVRPSTRKPLQGQGEAPAEEEPDPWADIDLEALREVNSAVVGWIAIPGTVISYPLIRPDDNDTYLSRSWDGRATSAGSIFLDYRVDWEPRGFNTIVYGHNMRNRTMFGSLREYRKADYWREHPEICLIDDEGVHYYDVFAAWEPRVTDIVFSPRLTGEEDRQALLDMALDRTVARSDVTPTVDSEILTLSTCTGVGHATRWIVQGVLRAEEAPETGEETAEPES